MSAAAAASRSGHGSGSCSLRGALQSRGMITPRRTVSSVIMLQQVRGKFAASSQIESVQVAEFICSRDTCMHSFLHALRNSCTRDTRTARGSIFIPTGLILYRVHVIWAVGARCIGGVHTRRTGDVLSLFMYFTALRGAKTSCEGSQTLARPCDTGRQRAATTTATGPPVALSFPLAHLACANPARPTLPALLEAVRGLRVTDLTSARR